MPWVNFHDYDRAEVYPLERLPADVQASIAEAVARPRPPAQVLELDQCQMPSRAWFEWYWQRGITPRTSRPKIPHHVRQAVLDRDQGVCGICGGEVPPTDIELDHIVPFAYGGPDTEENLRVTHSACNRRRGARIDG